MLRILIVCFFICLFQGTGFTQNGLFVHRNIRNAYDKGTRSFDGKPGANYWQNKAQYTIEASLDPKKRMLKGHETVVYFNNSPDTLKIIRLKLTHDLYKKGGQRDAEVDPEDVDDGTKIESFKPQNETWIRKIIESKNGDLIFATRRFGILSYNGKSFNISNQPKEYIKSSLNDILEDKNGILWVASDYGREMGDTLGGLWHSSISPNNPTEKTFTKISNKEVFLIFEDKDNAIWFSTRNMGLYRYDRKALTKFSE